MDANITKKRLGHMLSYDWIKILLTIVAAIVVWSLVFTMTATRITSAQKFTVYNYLGNLTWTYDTNFYEVYARAFNEGKFSDEVIELDQFDLPTQQNLASTQLEGHLGTGNGDLLFAAKIPNQTSDAYKDPVTGEDAHYTYLEEFLRAYRYQVFNMSLENEQGFFKRMEKYLNVYYGDFKNGTLDKGLAESHFRARIAKNKDKRYKKETQIAVGLESEYERLEKYRAALIEFYGYLEKGYVRIEATEIRNTKDPSIIDGLGAYSINLCPEKDALGNENPMKKLALTLGYQTTFIDEQGEEKPTTSAVDMHVCFFNLEGVESGYEYEGLLFVNELIRTALAA